MPTGGAAVPVHPGLPGDVPAVGGGPAAGRPVGGVRGAHAWRGRGRGATAEEGRDLRVQGAALLRRVPGGRQRGEGGPHHGGR